MTLDRDKVMAEGKELTLIAGRFTASAVVSKGKGFTVTTPGTGRYLITFDNNYDDDISFVASLQAATPGDLAGHVLVWDTIASNAVEVVMYNNPDSGTGGQPVAHDLAANEYINFVAVRKRTGV